MLRLFSRYFRENLVLVFTNVFFVALQVFFQTFLMVREMKLIIDNGVARQDMGYIYSSGARMLIFTLLAGVGTIGASYVSAKLVARINCSLFRDCYRRVIGMTPSEFDSFGASTLLTRTITDSNQIRILVINTMRASLVAPVVVICMLTLIFRINKLIFAILLCSFSLTLFILIYMGAGSRVHFEEVMKKTDRISLLMKENISGARTIRAFGNEEYEEAKMREASEGAMAAAIEANRRINFLSPSAMVIMNWAIVVIYLASSSQLRAGMASISDLLLVFQYLGYFIACLGVVPWLVNIVPKASVSCRRINELLDDGGSGQDRTDASPKSRNVPVRGEMGFRDVSFSHEGASDIVSDITFTAEAGKTTAIIGATGSGKTTIINLLMGFIRPVSGEITADGTDIRGLDMAAYRSCLSLATQKTLLFNDTVKNNISMYDDGISEERISEAVHAAALDDVIAAKEEGIMTGVSAGGTNFSGGQKQRISLARTVARDALVYIFDDAFSALDAETCNTVRKRIGEMLAGKTVIMVEQKIDHIRDADRIIMLDGGRIAGAGTHEELMRSCEEYRELYRTQCYPGGLSA